MHHLKPGLKRGPWTWEEEETLVAAHSSLGNSWSKIARELPGRTETDIKNHCGCPAGLCLGGRGGVEWSGLKRLWDCRVMRVSTEKPIDTNHHQHK
jgi:hypothetical protein